MFRSYHEDALAKSLNLQNGKSGPRSLPYSTPPSRNTSPPESGYNTPNHHRYKTTPPGSGYHTPSHYRYRTHLGYKAVSSESLASTSSDRSAFTKDYWKERAAKSRLHRRSRSRSPCPPYSESGALPAPFVSQEAFTRAFVYPSSLHHNLRLVVWTIVTLHVSIKTLGPCIFRPMYDGLREFLTFSYGPS
ncbi:unnamed protein product [Meganyctiphanes norvegica]|uniref:Uncharacterized protein n=1 Tax=Meganyctiphanes norvegica TaxID=48144 RepID=A0AAV2QGS2_MEGNR